MTDYTIIIKMNSQEQELCDLIDNSVMYCPVENYNTLMDNYNTAINLKNISDINQIKDFLQEMCRLFKYYLFNIKIYDDDQQKNIKKEMEMFVQHTNNMSVLRVEKILSEIIKNLEQ